jgi:sulfonate transport system permease protein
MSQMILRTDAPGRPGFRLNGWPWLLPALLLLLWYIAARERWMPEQILPAPSVVADTALSLLSGDLLAQWGFSLQHLALGLLLGAIAGTLLGALFGLVPAAAQRWNRCSTPWRKSRRSAGSRCLWCCSGLITASSWRLSSKPPWCR